MPPRKRKQAKQATADTTATDHSQLEPATMTVALLREELESRGLDTRGKKAELVARLEAELAGSSKGPSPAKKSRKAKKVPEPKEEEPEPEPEVRSEFIWGSIHTSFSPDPAHGAATRRR